MPTIRIANAAGFWGDWLEAPRRTVEQAEVDYLTLEYLAELTLSVLAHQRSRDDKAGFVTDFPLAIQGLIPSLRSQSKLKIITNAGGMNPESCARETAHILSEQGLSELRLGIVTGDDLLARFTELNALGEIFRHFETDEPLGERAGQLISINAYLGAKGIVEGLDQDARIVITGRCADASLTVGPAIKEFGWPDDDWDHLAAATVAGHLIECGAQATGGMFSDWTEALSLTDVGYPIAELDETGNVTVTKPDGTDGEVSVGTLSEQLIYEIGDPKHYLTPDVDADFSEVRFTQIAKDRVNMHGAKGRPAPMRYKVSLAYRDGYAVSTMLIIAGRNAEQKARACGELILNRLKLAGALPKQTNVEILGVGDSLPGVWSKIKSYSSNEPVVSGEVVLRLSARDPKREVLERLVRDISPLVTSGPPGVTGYTGPRAKPYPVLAYWPTTIDRDHVTASIQVRTAKDWLA